jgi:hypothetical protein
LEELLNIWQRMMERGQPKGEIDGLVRLNYQLSDLGTALAAVLVPAFALEAATRLIAEVTLYERCDGASALRLAVNGLDVLPFRERVTQCGELVTGKNVPHPVLNEIDALIGFRNSMAHDAPTINAPAGDLIQYKRGKTRIVEPVKQDAMAYPRLTVGPIPLDVSHILRAIDAHDAFVAWLRDAAPSGFADQFHDRTDDQLSLIRDMAPGRWADLGPVVEAAERLRSWLAEVTSAEREGFMRDLKRRNTLKSV